MCPHSQSRISPPSKTECDISLIYDVEDATWIESSSAAGTVSRLQKILELSNSSGCQPPFLSSQVTTLPSKISYLKVKIPCAVLYSCLVRLESNWTGVKPQEAKGMSTTDLSTPPLVCSFIDGKPSHLQQRKITIGKMWLIYVVLPARAPKEVQLIKATLLKLKPIWSLYIIHVTSYTTHPDLCSCFLLQ